jgi:hypothetical protein
MWGGKILPAIFCLKTKLTFIISQLWSKCNNHENKWHVKMLGLTIWVWYLSRTTSLVTLGKSLYFDCLVLWMWHETEIPCTWASIYARTSKISHTRGIKCVTCWLPFFNISEVGCNNMRNAHYIERRRRRRRVWEDATVGNKKQDNSVCRGRIKVRPCVPEHMKVVIRCISSCWHYTENVWEK